MDRSTTYSSLREHLKEEFDQVCEDHEVLHVTRKNGENIVLMSESDYLSLQETMHLSRSPLMSRRLAEAISEKGGKSLEEIKKRYGG